MSGSNDFEACIWHVQQTPRSSSYTAPVIDVASSPRSILVAFNDGTRIYDPQSGHEIHAIPHKGLTRWRLSVDGDKILVASRNSGFVWDLTSKTQVQSIDYNGDGAVFSPDGTYIASIYGKFLKIWKTQTGHRVYGASPTLWDGAVDVWRFAPDERLVVVKSKNGGYQILDVSTGRSLFGNITSVAFSLTFVACLRVHFNSLAGDVEIWDVHNCRLNSTIKVDNDVLEIALSPDDSRMVSLSPRDVKLWDLETNECLAHLAHYTGFGGEARVSFASRGASVSVEHDGRSRWWRISPASQINQSRNKHRMVFVLIAEKESNQDAPQQSYCCDKDGEWMLDHRSRRVLWIPPDERPQEIREHGRVATIRTESGKSYFVIPPSP